MNVEIRQLNYDRRLLEGSRASSEAAFRGHVKLAADRQRAGLPVKEDTVREINSNRAELAKVESALDGLQQRENSIRADFEKQLAEMQAQLDALRKQTPSNKLSMIVFSGDLDKALAAFVIAGGLAGVAGGLFCLFTAMATPDSLHWGFSARPVLMTILGGSGIFFGPLFGAVVARALDDRGGDASDVGIRTRQPQIA